MANDGEVIIEYKGDTSGIDTANSEAESKLKQSSTKLAKTVSVAVGAGLAAMATASISLGTTFETTMAKASTLFGDVQVDTGNLNTKMLELSSSSGIAADQLGESLYNALSAGIPATEDMGDAVGFLGKATKLAKAGFTDVDTAMGATVKVMNAYGMTVNDTDKIQKILMQTQNDGIVTVGELGSVLSNVTPTAAALGVSFEQVGAGIATMTAQGTPAAQATTQLNQLFAELGKQGTTAQKGLEVATKGTKYAGMSFQEMMKAGVPLNKVLDLMKDYADDNGKSMIDMFSSIEAGKAALAMSGDNAEAYTKALTDMSTETDVVSDAYDKVTDTVASKFNKAVNEGKNMLIGMYENGFKPVINALFDFYNFLKDNQWAMDIFLIALGTLATILVAYSISVLAATWSTSALGAVISFATGPIGLIILAIAALILVGTLLYQNWEAISQWLSNTWAAICTEGEKVWQELSDFWTSLWQVISDAFTKTWQGIQNAFNTYIDSVKTTFGGLWEDISDIGNNIKGVFQGIIDFIKNVFTGNWSGAWEAVKSIFSNIVGGFANIFKLPINFIIDGINSFTGELNKIKIPDWVPVVGGKGFSIGKIPRLKVGMDYVPSDFYPAYLDEGEAVLTKQENAALRSLGGTQALYNNLNMPNTNISQELNVTLYGNVEMDGLKVGKVVLRNLDEAKRLTT